MSSACPFRLILSSFIVVAFVRTTRAEEFSLTKHGYLDLTATNNAADVELGLELEPSKSVRIRPFLRAPFADADEKLVRIDPESRAGQAGLGVDYEMAQAGSFVTKQRLTFEGELGTKQYAFTPIGAMNSQSVQRQSFTGTLQGVFSFEGKIGDEVLLFAPQMYASYSRAYEAADKIGIVVPGQSGAPDTVKMQVVKGPSATPTLTMRIGAPFYHGALGQIAFGLFGVAELSGAKYKPWGDGDTYRTELWTYLYLSGSRNTRAGIAVFAESVRENADADREMGYGLFARLKVNVKVLEY